MSSTLERTEIASEIAMTFIGKLAEQTTKLKQTSATIERKITNLMDSKVHVTCKNLDGLDQSCREILNKIIEFRACVELESASESINVAVGSDYKQLLDEVEKLRTFALSETEQIQRNSEEDRNNFEQKLCEFESRIKEYDTKIEALTFSLETNEVERKNLEEANNSLTMIKETLEKDIMSAQFQKEKSNQIIVSLRDELKNAKLHFHVEIDEFKEKYLSKCEKYNNLSVTFENVGLINTKLQADMHSKVSFYDDRLQQQDRRIVELESKLSSYDVDKLNFVTNLSTLDVEIRSMKESIEQKTSTIAELFKQNGDLQEYSRKAYEDTQQTIDDLTEIVRKTTEENKKLTDDLISMQRVVNDLNADLDHYKAHSVSLECDRLSLYRWASKSDQIRASLAEAATNLNHLFKSECEDEHCVNFREMNLVQLSDYLKKKIDANLFRVPNSTPPQPDTKKRRCSSNSSIAKTPKILNGDESFQPNSTSTGVKAVGGRKKAKMTDISANEFPSEENGAENGFVTCVDEGSFIKYDEESESPLSPSSPEFL